MKKPKISIGIEIEINSRAGLIVDTKRWSLDNEHCGYELRSKPCKSPAEIKGLIKSIEKMGKLSLTSFQNTGTHIHIDFLNDSNVSTLDLTRLQVPKKDDGTWDNPLGNGKRFVWISEDDALWPAPRMYMRSRAKQIRPIDAYSTPGKHVESVKRFFLLGKRFSNVLFGLQHPTRRFNKYCHSIAGWNEKTLMKMETVQELCLFPSLLQSHRRHMFNGLSFPKFGTVEIRIIKGSLNHKEIWEQVYLFGKMAQLAKSSSVLPKSNSGNLRKDFVVLMGACGIHGKMRRRLNASLSVGLSTTKWTSLCFNCDRIDYIKSFYDYGLSRPMCKVCHTNYIFCAWCGYNSYREGSSFLVIDNKIPNGRHLCGSCHSIGILPTLKASEADGSLWIMGTKVGSGIDKGGPTTLRKMRELYK